MRLIVQNEVQQGSVDFQVVAVVINEAQFPKFVHEVTHARSRGTDHLRKRLLADLRDDLAIPDIENCIRGAALYEERVALFIFESPLFPSKAKKPSSQSW